jgi:hypothetical protein
MLASARSTNNSIQFPSSASAPNLATVSSWSNDSGVLNSPSARNTVAQWRQDKARQKHEQRKGVYDFPEVLRSRERLSNTVLKGKGSSPGRKQESIQDDNSNLIQQWLAAETQRADVVAKEKWKTNFVNWHNRVFQSDQDQADAFQFQGSISESEDPLSPSGSASWVGLDPADPDAVAIRKQTESYKRQANQMTTKQEQLKRDIQRVTNELEVEQRRRGNLNEMLRGRIDEKNAWQASAAKYENLNKKVQQETQDLVSRIATMQMQLGQIGNTLKVDEAAP